jgi:hypothetical protein
MSPAPTNTSDPGGGGSVGGELGGSEGGFEDPDGSVGVPAQYKPHRQVATMPASVVTRLVDALITVEPR